MGASESYELVVEMVADGADQTADDVENVEENFEDASDSVGDSADQMEGFATRWQGAMGAITAGLAVAAAGLLSQVPILGGLMDGLVAIIEAVAFQMDQVLRPVLQPVADGMFRLANAIFELEGPAGALVGILAAIAVVALPVLAAFGAIPALAAAVAVGLTLLLERLGLLRPLLQLVALGIMGGLAALQAFADLAIGAASTAIDMLTEAFERLVAGARNWGRDLMRRFADGIADMATAPVDAAKDAFDGVRDAISFDQRQNDRMAEGWGEDLMRHFSIGQERGKELLGIDASDAGSASGGGRPASGQQAPAVYLDGRRVDDQQRRRRGRGRRARQRDGV